MQEEKKERKRERKEEKKEKKEELKESKINLLDNEEEEEEDEEEEEKEGKDDENEQKNLSEINNKKCSLLDHKENEAINYCYECKIYMCNKCVKFHFELFKNNHHQYNLDSNFYNIFTGFCKEKNHNNKLEYYCHNHNQLCCVSCIAKIKGKGNGKHKYCKVCFIKKIKNKKKNKLNENINYLEELSKTLEQSLNQLKNIFEKISQNKEALKLKIQKIFTKVRNTLNEREDKLLIDIDKNFDNLFFKEQLIKEGEKLPNKTKILIENGKKINNEWNDKNKLNSIINDCIDIENNIRDIKIVNEKIKKSNSKINIEIKFNPAEDELNKFLENINHFGNIYYNKEKEVKISD